MQPWMRSNAGALEELAGARNPLETKAVRQAWSDFSMGRLHWSRAWAMVALGATA